MGHSLHGYFYKPEYGSSGKPEMKKFDDALDITDAQIELNKDKINNGVLPQLTTAQITAIATETNILLVYNIDEHQLELWLYGVATPL